MLLFSNGNGINVSMLLEFLDMYEKARGMKLNIQKSIVWTLFHGLEEEEANLLNDSR